LETPSEATRRALVDRCAQEDRYAVAGHYAAADRYVATRNAMVVDHVAQAARNVVTPNAEVPSEVPSAARSAHVAQSGVRRVVVPVRVVALPLVQVAAPRCEAVERYAACCSQSPADCVLVFPLLQAFAAAPFDHFPDDLPDDLPIAADRTLPVVRFAVRDSCADAQAPLG